MEIALHLGAHLTDEDQLIRCLMRNRALLESQGIAVPGTGTYRAQLRQLAFDLRDTPTNADTQEALLDGIIDMDEPRRVVFSNEGFLAQHQWVVVNSTFYPHAADRVTQLRRLFPEARVQVYMAIRDPASFLPALVRDSRSGGMQAVLGDSDPLDLRWSEMLTRVRAAAPDVPITVWCDEDTPLLWPEILRAVSGHDPASELEGWFAWYWELMTPERHEAMRRYFASTQMADDRQRRRVLSAMLDKFALPEATETVALPGWDEDYTDVLGTLYEQDLDVISTIPGVTLLEP